jgi:hypothetical protein
LHSIKKSDGKKKKEWKPFSLQSNLIQDSEEMKKMHTQFCTPTKNKINNDNEPNDAHKMILKEEILQIITENFMEMILDMVNQNVQEALKKVKIPKIKNTRRHRKK